MRYSAQEKAEIIELVEQSNLPVRQTLDRLSIRKSTFYNWLKRYEDSGVNGLIANHVPKGFGISSHNKSASLLLS